LDRRHFLAESSALAGLWTAPIVAAELLVTKAAPSLPDGLNPPGTKMAGIRTLPVVRGKYKVWTKKLGGGLVKVLLQHGNPAFHITF
jgi:proline iminopeptidase